MKSSANLEPFSYWEKREKSTSKKLRSQSLRRSFLMPPRKATEERLRITNLELLATVELIQANVLADWSTKSCHLQLNNSITDPELVYCFLGFIIFTLGWLFIPAKFVLVVVVVRAHNWPNASIFCHQTVVIPNQMDEVEHSYSSFRQIENEDNLQWNTLDLGIGNQLILLDPLNLQKSYRTFPLPSREIRLCQSKWIGAGGHISNSSLN